MAIVKRVECQRCGKPQLRRLPFAKGDVCVECKEALTPVAGTCHYVECVGPMPATIDIVVRRRRTDNGWVADVVSPDHWVGHAQAMQYGELVFMAMPNWQQARLMGICNGKLIFTHEECPDAEA